MKCDNGSYNESQWVDWSVPSLQQTGEENIQDNIPAIDNPLKDGYLLNQNSPNPFKSTTNITFYVPVNGVIDIIVYDITGKKVKTLYSGYKEKGAHTLVWNAEKIPAGIYIYRLEGRTASVAKKCLLID